MRFVIFSDMRNHTPSLDLEARDGLAFASRGLDGTQTIPLALRDVQVFALGVDGAGRTAEGWQQLAAFWREYFQKSGATLREFTVLRYLPLMTRM